MISEYELANIITGATRAEGGVARKSSATILGKAVEASKNGMVRVVPEGDVFAPDGDNTIIIPTSPSVRAGDTVQIGLVGGVSKRPMVVAAGGEGDRQDSAIASAAQAAQTAWNYAYSAHTAADQAKTAAQNAEADAARAEESAQQAVEDAATAKGAAEQAVEDAGTAYTAAQAAQTSANAAATAAQNAQADATTAKNAATQANTAANSALTQLSVIEDVAGTLDWISKHGTYTLTSDTTVQEGTVYFEKVGNDYIPIAEPEGNPHAQGWYTLDVTDSQSDYIMAHLAVTSAGLWVLPSGIGSASDEQHAAGYKTLLSSTGMTVYDDTGRAVATYGEGIVFDSSRELKIGNNNAYLEYYDSNGDEVADSLRISANSITLGGSDIADTYATKEEAATTGEGSGESVTVADGSRLRNLEVYGKSVQDGTPSPSAPVPIQVVSGANLINRTTETTGKYINASGVIANDASSSYSELIPVIEGEPYRLDLTAVYANNWNRRIVGYDSSGTYSQMVATANSKGDVTISGTIPAGVTQVRLSYRTDDTDMVFSHGPTAMPYVPYGSLGLRVSGKNLIDLTHAKASSNGLTFTYNADGSIHVQGTVNNTWAAIIERGTGYSITAPAGSYTISLDEPCTSANIYVRADVNGVANYGALINKTGVKTTATYSSSPTFCALVLSGLTSGTTYDFTFRVMFCAGSTALPYTPYVDSLTPIPLQGNVLASLPDGTKDVLTVDASGHCVITKNVAYTLYDGDSSEDWRAVSGNTSYYIRDPSIKYTGGNNNPNNVQAMTDRYPFAGSYNSGSSVNDAFTVGGSGSITNVAFKVLSTYAALTDWTAALAANPLRIVYPLAESTTVDIGYITMPELADGCTVQILASLTPTFGASWYTENGAALADFATKSELQVTAEGITSTVSSISSAKYLVSSNASWTLANIKAWANESTGNWSVVSTEGVRVGDTVYIKGTDTTRNCPVYMVGTVNSVASATSLNMTTHGYVDSIPANTVISTINQSAEAVKISASKVEIDGTTTFNAIKSQTDAAYDAKGAAAAIEVGGRNLLPVSQFLKQTNAPDVIDANGWISDSTPTSDTRGWGYAASSWKVSLDAGTYTLSWQVRTSPTSSSQGIGVYDSSGTRLWYGVGSSSPIDQSGSHTFEFSSSTDIGIMFKIYDGVMRFKLEKGNKATDWSPAPEDVDAAISTAQTTADTANNRSVAYKGTNNTGSTTAAKTVTCAGFALAIGATVSVYNQASNSVAGTLTLNVNGTGAKTIYIGAESTSATNQLLWHIGSTITYSYDGAYWHVADMPSNYYGTSCSTAAGTAQKQTTIPAGVIFKGVQLELPMQYANTAATPTLAIQNANNTASNLVNGILYGTGTIKPTVSNGYSWLAGMSVIFRFDGQYWRTGNQTIIDGGHILTGTISADRIAASSIAVGKLTVEAQSAMLNSNIEVGGTNYALDTATWNSWGKTSGITAENGILTFPSRTELSWINAHRMTIPANDFYGNTWTLSFYYRSDDFSDTSGNPYLTANMEGSATYGGSRTKYRAVIGANPKYVPTTEWQRVAVTFTPTDESWFDQSSGTVAYVGAAIWSNTKNSFQIKQLKLERGNKATDWSPAPEDMASAADSIEYIVGTQSAATGSWTGVTKETALVAGKTIAYRLPYAGSGNATLNLTLAGGGTTGAKAVYSMTTRVTTQYPANSIIQMTYDGTYWRTTGWYNTDTNARYVQFYNTIVAKSAIRAASIIGGDSSGYEEATAGAVFDLSYPIMWSTGAIAAAATDYSHIYTLCYDRTLATCYDSFTGTKNQIVYLVGIASGNKFTVDSSIITSTEPTEEDGKIYIPIGRLGNDTNGKTKFNFSTSLPVTPYAYLGGSFQRVDLSTSVRVSDVEGGLQMAVSDIATVTDTANAASDGVSSLNTRVNAQEETLTQVKTTFTFSTTGLTIGKSGSTMQSTFGNTSLQFKSGNTVVLELDAEKSTARADRFAIGKYQLKSVDNGNAIAFVYVGG